MHRLCGKHLVNLVVEQPDVLLQLDLVGVMLFSLCATMDQRE